MSSYNGLACPGTSLFYVCDKIDANSGKTPFVGCCNADPCLEGKGCFDKFHATFDPNVWKDIPPQTCAEQTAKWFACPKGSFLGCCDAGQDPCQSGGGCANVVWGKLSPDPVLREAFVGLTNGKKLGRTESSTSTNSPSSTSLSSTSITSASPSASSLGESNETSPSSSKQAQPESPGLSTGSIAGIAVGSATAGLLLGLLVAFFLFRRRKQRKSRPEYVHMPYAPGKGEKDLSEVPGAVAAAAARDEVRLGQFLLMPKPDHEMVTELGSLSALIQQHVENHYHHQPVRQNPKGLVQALATLGFAGGRRRSSDGGSGSNSNNNNNSSSNSSPEALVRGALDARTRFATLQHIITRVAFDGVVLVTPGSLSSSSAAAPGPPVSLLPPAVAAFLRSVPATERHRGNSEAVAAAMTKWRQLSAFLLHANRSDRTPLEPPEETTAQQTQQLARELNRFLGPFVLRGRDGELGCEQESHLQQVLTECARFGYVLFSQPSEYRFDYDDQGRLGGLVVCPGLERVSNEEGRRYATPQVLATPVKET